MEAKIQIHELNGSFFSNSNLALALAQKSDFGERDKDGISYSLYEVIYLIEQNKAELIIKTKKLGFSETISKYLKKDKTLLDKYLVFKDLRKKGHVIKAGLKFGVDFRCYAKSESPKRNHAKYLVYILDEKEKLGIREFTSKSRVAHSTGKILLVAIIDSERDITYLEVNWKKR